MAVNEFQGFVAKILMPEGSENVNIGEPIAIIVGVVNRNDDQVENKDDIAAFAKVTKDSLEGNETAPAPAATPASTEAASVTPAPVAAAAPATPAPAATAPAATTTPAATTPASSVILFFLLHSRTVSLSALLQGLFCVKAVLRLI